MAEKFDVGVIGLGKFGFTLAKELVELGHTVIGVDRSESMIRRAQDVLSQVYQSDAEDKKALQQLGFADLPHVIVSIGGSMEKSIMITLNLKELGAERVWVKAVGPDHEKVLKRVGADQVVFPERDSAIQLAHRLGIPGLVGYLPLGGGVVLQELVVDKWDGKTLREIDPTNQHGIQIVAVRRVGEKEFSFIPKAGDKLSKGDILLVIGGSDSLGEVTA